MPKCFRFSLNTLWPLLPLGWCSSPFPHHSSPVILQQCISQLQPSFFTPRGLFPDVAAHWISLAIVYSIRFLGPLRPIKLALKKTGSQKVLILKSPPPPPQVILMIERCWDTIVSKVNTQGYYVFAIVHPDCPSFPRSSLRLLPFPLLPRPSTKLRTPSCDPCFAYWTGYWNPVYRIRVFPLYPSNASRISI